MEKPKNYYLRITYALKDDWEWEGIFKEEYEDQLLNKLYLSQAGREPLTFDDINGDGKFTLSPEIMKHTEVFYSEYHE